MNWTKDEFRRASHAYLSAFQEVARELGYKACHGSKKEQHPLVQMMGGLAWGRHGAETGTKETLKERAVEYGYLRGQERMLVAFCNLSSDNKTRRLLIDTVAKALRGKKE